MRTVISCLEPEANEVPPYGYRDHLHRPSRRCVENIAGTTNRFPQSNPVLQISNSYPTSTARTRISPLLPVTKNIRAKHSPLLTALHPASLRNVHVPARHLSRFVSSLCAPPSSAHLQRAEQISLGTPKELLN